MKKILILANNDIGLYKFRKELIEELLRKRYIVTISLPEGHYIECLKEMGCHFIKTNIDRRGINPFKDLLLLCKYIKIIRQIAPDMVLTYTIKPNVYGGIASRLTNKQNIANITGLGSAVENKGVLQKITIKLYRVALTKAKCIFFQNSENKDFFIKRRISPSIHRLIPGSGVNLDFFRYLEYPSDETIEFLFIARVMKEKGIDEYLEMAEYIKSKYTNTVFHILGFCEEAYGDKLKLLQERNIIVYHGLQEDIRPFLQQSHCTIHPSYYPEGMSNVLLESEASGRPVITTNRSGCKETMEDGKTGFLFEPKNVKDLIDKVEKFILLPNSKKKEMGIEGRKKVELEFNRKNVVNMYINEIEKK